jgi:hypothetical protein
MTFHLHFGDNDGMGKGSDSGKRATRAKGGNEVAAGVVNGRQEVSWRSGSRCGEARERSEILLRAVTAEHIEAPNRRWSKIIPPLFGLGDRIGSG